MSDQVSGPQRRGRGPLMLVLPAIVGAALAGSALSGVLLSVPAAVAQLLDFDWPRWIHNLADLVQVATPPAAILAWVYSRRRDAERMLRHQRFPEESLVRRSDELVPPISE